MPEACPSASCERGGAAGVGLDEGAVLLVPVVVHRPSERFQFRRSPIARPGVVGFEAKAVIDPSPLRATSGYPRYVSPCGLPLRLDPRRRCQAISGPIPSNCCSSAYNAVKHYREGSLSEATLGNAIAAVKACYVLAWAQFGHEASFCRTCTQLSRLPPNPVESLGSSIIWSTELRPLTIRSPDNVRIVAPGCAFSHRARRVLRPISEQNRLDRVSV